MVLQTRGLSCFERPTSSRSQLFHTANRLCQKSLSAVTTSLFAICQSSRVPWVARRFDVHFRQRSDDRFAYKICFRPIAMGTSPESVSTDPERELDGNAGCADDTDAAENATMHIMSSARNNALARN